MTNLYTPQQMTNWLSSYYKKKGYETEVYSDTFLPARVPVYARKSIIKGKKKIDEEVVIDIINSSTIKSSDFFYMLHIGRTLTVKGKELASASSSTFYQYYFPRAKVYWAYPDYLKEDEKFEKFKELCQKRNVGLIKVSKNKIEEDQSILVVPLIDEVFKKFESVILSFQKLAGEGKINKQQLKQVKDNMYKELDSHIERTNEYLIYYPEPVYKRREITGRTEGRNISFNLIDRIAQIQNLKYKNILLELGNTYRTKIEDDYDIALDLIKRLWKDIGLEYPEFQKDFEPVLLLNPQYRDHFLHQLNVFLLGCYIIDKLYNEEPIKSFKLKFGNPIEDMWLLASTYHDYNYNIENYNEWITTFFKNSLFLDKNPSILRLDECYVREDYMFKTKELCDAFNNLIVDKITLLFFYDKIIGEMNHGLLGALSLLKLFDQKSPTGIKRNALLQAARAIALHDEGIWEHFAGRSGSEFSKKKFMETLQFNKDPLSFLLIFCDTIQEWGRVGRDYEKTGARLDDIGYSKNLVWVNISVRNEEAFNYKKDEIDRVKKFLLDERFKIKLSSRPGLGSNLIERYMEGK